MRPLTLIWMPCAVLVACAGSHGEPEHDAADLDGGAPIDARIPEAWEAFLSDFRATLCEREVRCQSFTWLGRRAYPGLWCVEESGRLEEAYVTSVARGRVRFDPVAAAACLAAYRELACGSATWPEHAAEDDPCRDAFEPLVELGGACAPLGFEAPTWLSECREGFCHETDGCPSTCVPRGAVGDPCDFPERGFCGAGLSCYGRVCSAPPDPTGDACGGDYDCAGTTPQRHGCVAETCVERPLLTEGASCDPTGLGCEDHLACHGGVCVARAPEGAPCGVALACARGGCDVLSRTRFCVDDAPYCADLDGTGYRCSRSVRGAACQSMVWPDDPDDPCVLYGDQVCRRTAWTPEPYEGNCMPRRAVGDVCDPDPACGEAGSCIDASCGESARCVEGRCAHVAMPGEPCGGDVACPIALGCVDGRCASRPWIGEPCDEQERRCLAGVCAASGGGDGTCQHLPEGAPCTGESECSTGCDDNCLPRAGAGAPCGRDAECADGLACGVFDTCRARCD